jgi:aryl-alcohol dehydrogenase-like predicted oxidoreductase
MRYNQLGRTGLFVSELCLGTMTFGGSGEMWSKIGTLQQDAVDRIVGNSLAAGINFIDTADVYSSGESEKLLGQSLKTSPSNAATSSSPPRSMALSAPARTIAAPRAAISWTA